MAPSGFRMYRRSKALANGGGDAETRARIWSARQYGQEGIMSVFGSIVSAIFGSKHAANVAPSAGAPSGSPASPGAPTPSGSGASPGAAAGAAAAKPISREDVEAILKRLHDDQKEDFDWRRSIVDLMKLLKLDSSLSAASNWHRSSATPAPSMAPPI